MGVASGAVIAGSSRKPRRIFLGARNWISLHILGEHATDVIGDAVTTMTMESAIEDLAIAVKPHPTISETLMEAAMDWNRLAIHKPRRR